MIENSDFSSSDPEILYVTRFFGMLITVHSMRRIYIRKQKKLITDGLFRYSRHPMYIGLTLLAMDVWWPRVEPLPLLYFVSLSAFAVGITVAGFFQEKETLALYGKEAEEYYARTPRFLGIPRKG